MKRLAIALAEQGLVPEALLRAAIRRELRARLREEAERAGGDFAHAEARFAALLAASPIALHTDAANAQHYEVPAAFFALLLGPRRKYSSAWFADGASLAQAEERMLALTCARAELRDGMRVLDLGCGWGALTLFVAEHFPNARVLAVSNSKSQREHVLAECARRGFEARVEVRTADVATFAPAGRFDRVLSIEMFEHVRNWPALFARIAGWLEPHGKLFLHVFCHRAFAYPFEDRGAGDWMAREFFTGGNMPSAGLVRSFADALAVEAEWRISGLHYARTAEAWLANLQRERDAARRLLGDARAVARWRLFLLAVAELFAFAGGEEWGVAHYRLAPTGEKR
jgi:cyclopropane-fatty-acyl-phospholipid synthase